MRRTRFLMVAVSLGTLAAVGGIAQLVPRGEPQSEGLAAVPHAAAHDRVGSGSLAAQLDDTTGGRDPDPTLTASTSAAEDGSTDDTAAELAATDTGPTAAVDDPTRPGDKIKRKNPPPVAEAEVITPCRLAFTGIPLPTAQNLAVKVGTLSHHIEAMQMDVEFSGIATAVRVADKRYSASRQITRAECEAGPVTVEIHPMDARVKFEGPPADAVVVCKAGCRPSLIDTNQTAKDFRPVPIVDGTVQPVTLVLKHIDYEPVTIDEELVPGPQTIRVAMVPRVP
jgi:hypothetical protein